MHTSPHRACERGFTLIEAGIVLAIAAILATAAAPSMRDTINAHRLDNAARQLASDVQLTRSSALLRNQPVRLSFLTGSTGTCYVVHTGNAGSCTCSGDGPAACQGGAREIKTVVQGDSDRVRVSANVGSITFDPMHGTSTPTGTVRVIGDQGREVRHVINVMGRVRTCSPSGISGYRAC